MTRDIHYDALKLKYYDGAKMVRSGHPNLSGETPTRKVQVCPRRLGASDKKEAKQLEREARLTSKVAKVEYDVDAKGEERVRETFAKLKYSSLEGLSRFSLHAGRDPRRGANIEYFNGTKDRHLPISLCFSAESSAAGTRIRGEKTRTSWLEAVRISRAAFKSEGRTSNGVNLNKSTEPPPLAALQAKELHRESPFIAVFRSRHIANAIDTSETAGQK
ncbi:hypothetical protein EDB89DRAFT_1909225 [Lactarius sanguifluus]|nr:hypothetical protein EDB89DRAFT_1909225 [Lactarius sanguifluus]